LRLRRALVSVACGIGLALGRRLFNCCLLMLGPKSRLPAAIALLGTILGLVFAMHSTLDYAEHLDRRLHDVHCSYVPGAPATAEAESCRAALYSPYSAVLKQDYWGGVPITLFALGAFAFFAGFSLYLAIAADRAPRMAVIFHAVVALSPSLVSLYMLYLSAVKLGVVCEICVGLYVASALVSLGGLLGLLTLRDSWVGADHAATVPRRPRLSPLFPIAWLAVLGFATLLPAVAYASRVPDHTPFLTRCGQLKRADADKDQLLTVVSPRAVRSATLFQDPLCVTCRSLHQRLVQEGLFDRLSLKIVLFPLDSSCNWMLDRPLHQGACTVSKAVLCGHERALAVLEWAFDEQEYLTRAAARNEATLRAVLQQRWGPELLQCVDDNRTKDQLNRHLHFASDNNIPVSTPQMFLGSQRICDEDTDLGLRFTLSKLAPEVLR
jgi:uncharacterized membrane protein